MPIDFQNWNDMSDEEKKTWSAQQQKQMKRNPNQFKNQHYTKGFSRKKRMIISIVAAFILAVGGFLGYWFILRDKNTPPKAYTVGIQNYGVEALKTTIKNIKPQTLLTLPQLGEVTLRPGTTQIEVNGTAFILDGLYKSANFTAGERWNFSLDTVDANITLYAKWSHDLFEVERTNSGLVLAAVPASAYIVIPKEFIAIKDTANGIFNPVTTSVVFENKSQMQTIGKHAFYGAKIAGLSLPATVTTVREKAFAGCTFLQEIVIPSGVQSMGFGIFHQTNIKKLTLPFVGNAKEEATITTLEWLFRETEGNRSNAPESLKELVLSNGATALPEEAFYGNTFLEKIDLPGTLTFIGENAFFGCSGLTEMILRAADVPETEDISPFEDCQSLIVIYVPAVSLAAYQTAWGTDVMHNGASTVDILDIIA